jgi:transcription initiation factor TFIIIB Brf1 subunit/transcription initiation factor TFIIB
VQIAEQQDQIRYQSICGKEVVFDYDSGEYYFVDSGLVCEDVIEINPFDE